MDINASRLTRIAAILLIGFAAERPASAQPQPVAELMLQDKQREGHPPRTEWLGFSPDGKWLAARFDDRDFSAQIRVWSRNDWKSADISFDSYEDASEFPSSCVFEPTGKHLYAAGKGLLYAYPLPLRGDSPRTISLPVFSKPDRARRSLTLLGNGKTLAVATREAGSLRVDQFPMGGLGASQEVFREDLNVFKTPALSPDGKLLAAGLPKKVGKDKQGRTAYSLEIWTTGPGKRRAFDGLTDPIIVAGFSADGAILATGSMDCTLNLYDVQTGKIFLSFTENFTVSDVAFHPKRSCVAYVTYDRDGEPNLFVADYLTGKRLGAHSVNQRGGATNVAFSPDGEFVATVGGDGMVRVWKFEELIKK